MTDDDSSTQLLKVADDTLDRSTRRRTYSVTTETMKKVEWVQELLKSDDPRSFTIRGLANEVKQRYGTSMNTNLLSELLQAARNDDFSGVKLELTKSKRGRPTTLSPNTALRRNADKQVRKITETISSRPEHLVCAEVAGKVEIEGFATSEDVHQRIRELLAKGVPISDIAYYQRGQVEADFHVTLSQPIK